MKMHLVKGRVLLGNGDIVSADLTLSEGLVESIGGDRTEGKVVDAAGGLILPGAVDLHGDGFERHIMPRPGVSFSRSLGLLDTDRAMTASGITTAFHGLTWSWEPGLRGGEAARAFMEDFDRVRPRLGCDTRLHLRYETYNLPALDEMERWIEDGRVDVLAFNDHMDNMFSHFDNYNKMTGYLNRTGLDRDEFMALLREIHGRKAEVPAGIERLAAAARERGVPMASHDDPDPELRAWYHGLGCTISEFPLDEATARTARDLGDAVVLGAPNALRGKSHIKRLMARDAIRAGLCDVLTSDYYYPAQLQAAFALAREGVCDFSKAWGLISSGPARAVGLDDRGVIEIGKRADLVVVDDRDTELPMAVLTLRQGRVVFSAGG